MIPASGSLALPGLSTIEQTPIIVEKLIAAAAEEQLCWKPSPDRWSINEVLAHMADVESAGFRSRIQQMLESDTPRLEPYDQNATYAAGAYSAGKPRENLKAFCHERDRSLSFLRYVPGSSIGRKGLHGELGPITIGQLMNEWAFHDLGHIRQIAELYRSCAFYPVMGPFQRYYTIKP